MNSLIADLLIVQDRDSKIMALELELKRLPAEKLRLLQQTEQKKLIGEKTKKAVQEVEIAIKNTELDVQTRKNTLARLKTQQFETRKNEEYQAIGVEIQRYEEEIDSLETHELDLMEELENKKELRAEAQKKLESAQKVLNGHLDALEKSIQITQEQVRELKEERTKLTQNVEGSLLLRYEKMMKSKGLPVIVEMSPSAQCGGCHMKVIRVVEIKVHGADEIAECDKCGRFLY